MLLVGYLGLLGWISAVNGLQCHKSLYNVTSQFSPRDRRGSPGEDFVTCEEGQMCYSQFTQFESSTLRQFKLQQGCMKVEADNVNNCKCSDGDQHNETVHHRICICASAYCPEVAKEYINTVWFGIPDKLRHEPELAEVCPHDGTSTTGIPTPTGSSPETTTYGPETTTDGPWSTTEPQSTTTTEGPESTSYGPETTTSTDGPITTHVPWTTDWTTETPPEITTTPTDRPSPPTEPTTGAETTTDPFRSSTTEQPPETTTEIFTTTPTSPPLPSASTEPPNVGPSSTTGSSEPPTTQTTAATPPIATAPPPTTELDCSTTAMDEVYQAICEHRYGTGWVGAVHQENTIMCLKFFTELHKNSNYTEVQEFCEDKGATVAPFSNKKEHRLGMCQVDKALAKKADKAETNYVYIGAQRNDNGTFVWEYDNLPLSSDKPYPPFDFHHDCLAVEVTPENKYGIYAYYSCIGYGNSVGAICAKPLIPK